MSAKAGALSEDVAALYLQENNLLVLQRNFRCKLGEIDIIAKDANCVIFAEVRFRKNDNYGSAAESVTNSKQKKIIRAAKFYLQTKILATDLNFRFDVIAISQSIESPKIEWIKDAFNE